MTVTSGRQRVCKQLITAENSLHRTMQCVTTFSCNLGVLAGAVALWHGPSRKVPGYWRWNSIRYHAAEARIRRRGTSSLSSKSSHRCSGKQHCSQTLHSPGGRCVLLHTVHVATCWVRNYNIKGGPVDPTPAKWTRWSGRNLSTGPWNARSFECHLPVNTQAAAVCSLCVLVSLLLARQKHCIVLVSLTVTC